MRLNAFLARSGVASRRKADELIKAGRVTVNGQPGELNTDVGRHDRVAVDGQPVARQELAYVLLHKPAGVVTTASDPQGRRTVVDLVDHPDASSPSGASTPTRPARSCSRTTASLRTESRIHATGSRRSTSRRSRATPTRRRSGGLREGVELEDGRTAPAKAKRFAPGRVELVLHEGRNRQVRRMLEAVGHPVSKLHRPRLAGLDLDGLAPGEWRELKGHEVDALRAATAKAERRAR